MTRPQPQSEAGRLSSPALVGRTSELERIIAAVLGPPSVVVVEGEAGVGKTRLVLEALADPRISGRTILTGHCHELRRPFTLGPVVEALRGVSRWPEAASLGPLAGLLLPLLPELSGVLPPAPEIAGDDHGERHRLLRAGRDVISALGPAILVLEDLHWADEATSDLLATLALDLPPKLSLVVTMRPAGLDDPGPASTLRRVSAHVEREQIVLEPLDADDVGELVRAILGADAVSREFASYLHERTGGLPFAIEEVLRLMLDRRDVVRKGDRWTRRMLEELEVPAAIRDSILERARRLSADARRVLKAAAVVGEPASDGLLRRVAGLEGDASAGALTEGLDAGLLVEVDGAIAFRHSLAAQSVRESIRGPERRRLHRAAAAAIADADPGAFARLAHHHREAGDVDAWVRAAEAAADRAEALHDDRAACRFLGEVIAAPGLEGSDRVRLAVRFAQAAMHALAQDEAARIVREVLAEHDLAPGDRGELRLGLGLLLTQAGETSEGVREIAGSVEDLSGRPELLARALVNLAVPWVVEGTAEEHRAFLERAAEPARRGDDPVRRTGFLADRASVLLYLGDPEGWKAIGDLPTEGPVDVRRETARAHANASIAALWLGHDRQAAEQLEKCRSLAEELRYARLLGGLDAAGVLIDWYAGRWEGLVERTARMDPDEPPHVRVDADLVRGLWLFTRGQTDQAAPILRETMMVSRRAGAIPVLAAAAGALAEIELAQGREDAALAVAGQGLAVLEAKGIWAWSWPILVPVTDACCRSGRSEEAGAILRRAALGLRGRDAPAAAAALASARAVVASSGEEDEDRPRWSDEAVRRWESIGRPLEVARARERRALASRDEKAAAEDLLAALEIAIALRTGPDERRIRRRLRDRGISLSHRRGRKGYGDRLSPREREIVAMVVEGRTNREIAATLFLSPRTVEHHVANAMRKLRVGSRRELGRSELVR